VAFGWWIILNDGGVVGIASSLDSKDQLKEFFDVMARDLERFLVRRSQRQAPKKS